MALAKKGSVVLFDRFPIDYLHERQTIIPKLDIVIHVDATIPYEEELLLIKNTIWNHIN